MTRGRVLLTDHAWPGTEVEAGLCDAAGYDLVEAPPGATEDVLAGLAAGVDGILTCWAQVTAKVIAASPALRVVSRMGIGLDNIDLAAAAARQVAVTRVPDYCVEEVSDHVVGLLHAWARCILTADRDVRAGVWDPGRYAPRRVSSLVTGVWGLGPTGRRTAAALDVFPAEPEVPAALLSRPDVILTPYIAFSSAHSVLELRRRSTADLLRVLAELPPLNPVALPGG